MAAFPISAFDWISVFCFSDDSGPKINGCRITRPSKPAIRMTNAWSIPESLLIPARASETGKKV